MGLAQQSTALDEDVVLADALVKASKDLGLTQTEMGLVIGKDRTFLGKGRLSPASKSGELGLLFIRCFRALFSLMGGNLEHMRHWMHNHNVHTGGVPAKQIQTITGLLLVVEYLDAMRAKL